MSSHVIEEKLACYGKKFPGLSAYMNFWVWFITVAAGWGLVTSDFTSLSVAQICIKGAYFFLALMAALTIRGIDPFAYWINLTFLGYITTMYLYDTIDLFLSMLKTTGNMAGSLSEAAAGNAIVASGVAIGTSIVTGAVVIGSLITLIPILCFVIYYISVFVAHRTFFLKSLKQLQAEFD